MSDSEAFSVIDSMSSTELQDDAGNTKPRRQISEAKHWVFTWNNYPDNAREILSSMSSSVSRLVCQTEIAPTTGTKHIQGYVCFIKKCRAIGKISQGVHWEKCVSFAKAIEYCKKAESRDPEGWIYEYPVPVDIMQVSELKPWMKEIYDMKATKPHPRTIYWYWEPVGGVGKTDFVKFMGITFRDSLVACRAGKSADILTAAVETANMYLFDFPREAEHSFSPWTALEQIKDGFVSDGKLKKTTRTLYFNRPHVVCFANWPPPRAAYECLSGDKLRVRHICKTVELCEICKLN